MKTLALLTTGCVLVFFAFARPVRAATTIITNGTDAELRAAVANCGTIVFNFDGVITLTNEIAVTCAVTIDATGRSVTLSGGNNNRLFRVESNANLTLINLALANGRSSNAGGAIYNEGTVIAQDSRFLNNLAVGPNGVNGTNGNDGVNGPSYTAGQPGQAGTAGGGAAGGAIFSSSALNLWRCHFGGNSATGGAGGNGGAGGSGGRLNLNFGSPGAAGGSGGGGGDSGTAQGGSVANLGVLFIDGCTFSNSGATSGNGGAGGPGGPYGGVNQYALTGRGGTPGLAQGGAVFTMGSGWVSNSLFVGNTCLGGNAGDSRGYISGDGWYSTNGGTAFGGAIYFGSNSRIANSTLFSNAVRGGNVGFEALFYPQRQGGDASGGAIACAGFLQAVNLTVDRNSATGGLRTHVVWGRNGNSLGGSIANTGGVFQIVNSILSGGTSNNTFGVITDLGHNLSSDATPVWTSGTSLNNSDPLLLPLANNGGPTLTMALHAGSPALNNGDCALAPPTDQRGFPRPDGPGCDIGATEGASAPSLQILRVNSSTNLLRWTALAGRAYRVDAATSLNAWSPYSTNVAAASGLLEMPVPVSAPERFYRLSAE